MFLRFSCSSASPQVSRVTKAPKYTYVRLSELKPGTVVNVYGVVVFFKQPYRTRGTGESSITITCSPKQILSTQRSTSAGKGWVSGS